MSLRLRQAVAGRPTVSERHGVGVLNVDGKGYIAYPSSGNIVLLNTQLELVDTLRFWPALPYYRSESSTSLADETGVQGVCCSPENLIVAWSATHIVIWQSILSPSKNRISNSKWEVHSTLVASAPITCLDLKNGTLVIGTVNGIEVWRMDPKAEVVVWDRLCDRSYLSPSAVHLAPFASHIAWIQEGGKIVHILTMNAKGEVAGAAQELRHPREIDWIGWRYSGTTNGDAALYTITSNCVLRIYSPVLDDPTWFQLLSSLDSKVFSRKLKTQYSVKGKGTEMSAGRFWILNSRVLRLGLTDELAGAREGKLKVSPEVRKVLESLEGDESDLVAWIGPDGTLALRSIINLDRKPPTLLKTLPISTFQLPPDSPSFESWKTQPLLLHLTSASSALSVILAPTASTPLSIIPLSLTELFSTSSLLSSPAEKVSVAEPIQLSQSLAHFVRTPNGRGLLAVGIDGEVAAWEKQQLGKVHKAVSKDRPLLGKGRWTTRRPPLQSAIFAKGRAIVFYSRNDDGEASITLQHLDDGVPTPSESVQLPHFAPKPSDDVEMILAVSDIDDGLSGRGRRTQRALIMAATKSGETWIWRTASKFISTESTETDHVPEITLLSHYRLPVHTPGPHLILPVDPMGWHQSVIDWKTDTPLQDMVLTVTDDGVLEFWQPRLGQHLVNEDNEVEVKNGDEVCQEHQGVQGSDLPWVRSGIVQTGKRNIVSARCSSRKKTVLVCELADGSHEMSIWDSNISEFSTGLELTHVFPRGEVIQDLDWTTTSDLQSVLAVGFFHRVVLVCEQRMSYIDVSPGWAPFLTIDMKRYTSVPISDSIWLAGGSLAVGTGNQIYLFSRFLDRDSPIASPSASVKSVPIGPSEPEDIFQLIAHQNGPLWDYHPTMLAQCLLWNKVDLVKGILIALVKSLKESEEKGRSYVGYKRLDPIEFYSEKQVIHVKKVTARKYDDLFDTGPASREDDDDEFSARLIDDLVERLDGPVSLALSYSEKSALATVAQATLEVEQQRRSLDLCGLRYLISLRMFMNQHRRAGTSGTVTPASGTATPGIGSGAGTGVIHTHRHRSRLAFRNIVWAMHSESQEVLLGAATECCGGGNGKMVWADAKRLGVFLWLKSTEAVKSQLEIIARNRFMQDEDRDPTCCSLIFFALGKKKIVHGLWRQAPGHKEQQLMLKFLANDFELPRWKTAAMKNAYALLSKQRYEYAAAFFMLAGSPKDALNVCLRQMDDWQLAVALARVVEGGRDGPLMKWILNDFVIPTAFAGGHRWLASWGFWMLGRRDLAVRILISPMTDVVEAYSPTISLPVGDPENDDPSLLLLFQHLRSSTLQTAKGTSEISAKLEFDFVLHNARVFFRMGCHTLALDLLRSWSFERPIFVPPTPKPRPVSPATTISSSRSPSRPSLMDFVTPSYNHTRRPSFMLSSGHGRRESMRMDMDIMVESGQSTRVPSPSTITPVDEIAKVSEGNSDISEKGGEEVIQTPVNPQQKIGSLMKGLKQDVQQGAMEFNMDSFF